MLPASTTGCHRLDRRTFESQYEQSSEAANVPDRVVAEMGGKGKQKYKLRWKGYSKAHDTWEMEDTSPGGKWPSKGVQSWREMPVVRRWHRLKAEERARRGAEATAAAHLALSGGEPASSSGAGNSGADHTSEEPREMDEREQGGEDGADEESDDEDDEWKVTTKEEEKAVKDAVDKEEKDQIAQAAKAVEAEEVAALVQDEITKLPFAIHFALEASGEVSAPCTLQTRHLRVGAARCSACALLCLLVALLAHKARPTLPLCSCRRICLRLPENLPAAPSSRRLRPRAALRTLSRSAATTTIPRGASCCSPIRAAASCSR